jgi:hypothetical protein
MTKEEKELLLKDLSARLPYGLKVECEKYPFPVTVLYAGNIDEVKFVETGGIEHICLIKPYLRPISSMTEEEKKDFGVPFTSEGLVTLADTVECMDWLNVHHFDYRGLIEKGLALEASEGIYKTE